MNFNNSFAMNGHFLPNNCQLFANLLPISKISSLKFILQMISIIFLRKKNSLKISSTSQIYFHRRQLRHGQEGVELGSDAEVKWTAHLLQISDEYLHKVLTTRVTETRSERLYTPLGIDQALDARDAFAKVLYSGLFNWYVIDLFHD